ncbi:hypothetical protein L2E82_21160 [Cichorium intybus]|uniref:Uncharacterized protein n=1 Tax=Cichorium intybus TaxID=13427 RepID=A0ACB9DVS6_CICIN|nr:hypothetical protein L2E82_21160 [Cichorium intybus]
MGTSEKSVQLKVFVDKKKKKVMFAEADEDFVQILFSFFTLPLGTIAKLSRKHAGSNDIKIGSLTSLYESVINLDDKYFSNEHCKDALVNPSNSSASVCQKLKVNLDETKPIPTSVPGGQDGVVYLKKKASFIITDDLNVAPVMLDTSIALLNSLGVEYIDLLDERTIYFGLEEFSNLLKWSLLTNNPLTNLVLGGNKPLSCLCSCSSCVKNSVSDSTLILSNSRQTQTVKLLVQKSKKKVLCAQVENRFVELLFSFLTIPLGAYERLTKDHSSSVGITNLYNSISRLGDEKYLKTEDVKTMLLRPKLAANYLRVTNLLPIYEVDTRPGSFLKEQSTFIVSDDLEVSASPSIATILKFNTLGVPVGDIEVLDVSIGEHEALLILKASLTSELALTDCLNEIRKKPKSNSST